MLAHRPRLHTADSVALSVMFTMCCIGWYHYDPLHMPAVVMKTNST